MKKYRWLFIILGVAALGLALVFGAAFGAGITYFLLQAEPVQASFAAPVDIGNEEGVLISSVKSGSSVAEAGLVRGDIILEVDGEPVNHIIEIKNLFAEMAPGDIVQLTVLHGDETRTLDVELDDFDGFAYLGIGTCDVLKGGKAFPGDAMGDIFSKGLPLGAEIVEVVAGSPAEKAGLQVGDLILSVDQKPVGPKGNLADLIQKYAPGDEVTLEIQSEEAEESREVSVTLGANPDDPEQAYLGVAYQIGMPQFDLEDGEFPFMEMLPFGELPEGFEGGEGMPHFFFHHDKDFEGELPEGWEEDGEFFFHGIPSPGEEGLPHFDIPELPEGVENAVIVSEVLEDTPAEEAGLQPGDLIISVDGEPIEVAGVRNKFTYELEQ